MTLTAPGRPWRAPVLLLAPFAATALTLLLSGAPAWALPLDTSRQTSSVTVSARAHRLDTSRQTSNVTVSALAHPLDVSRQASGVIVSARAHRLGVSRQASNVIVSALAHRLDVSRQASYVTVSALAHPLDISRQTSYVTVAADAVTVEVDLAAGVLVAPDFIAALDSDGDKNFSETEGRAYATAMLAQLTLRVDDVAVPLTLSSVELPTFVQTRAGYGILHVTASAPLASAAGDHRLFYRNDFTPLKPQFESAVLTPKKSTITVGVQHRDEDQRQVETVFTVHGDTAPVASAPAAADDGWGVERLLSMLADPSRSVWLTVGALGLAMLLGAFHALTPGHGKTMMAAYLVGSGGRLRDALALGASVTVTHTSSVLAIGAVALLASRFALPDVLVPALELISGALVLALGLRLLWQRRAALPWMPATHHNHSHDHAHPHAHSADHGRSAATDRSVGTDHRHDHGHGFDRGADHDRDAGTDRSAGTDHRYDQDHGLDHMHDHGHGTDHRHDHGHGIDHGLAARRAGLGAVVALGISGGLVPCPEALGVMILAVGLGHIAVGMLLIVSFSLGLAAVLIGIGILLVRARSFASRTGRLPTRWATCLPPISAAVVVLLGAGLIVRTLSGSS
ncbi:HoxN/HupN/NixA family nickel/cobalt transporter [Paractinoplanes durhamensis]|uniref:High-affinity nickel-transporter n=1 Tax=Paractinoplanes durhamensis TaxID=113563 RepID=A0ABQ3YS05_9ACTN|nr:hypothetical protein [Actinoplanes durhamensis]GIE00363.1 hypothetical protein Adu01nite_17130 [Actinoplanes durhamensis]